MQTYSYKDNNSVTHNNVINYITSAQQ